MKRGAAITTEPVGVVVRIKRCNESAYLRLHDSAKKSDTGAQTVIATKRRPATIFPDEKTARKAFRLLKIRLDWTPEYIPVGFLEQEGVAA